MPYLLRVSVAVKAGSIFHDMHCQVLLHSNISLNILLYINVEHTQLRC